MTDLILLIAVQDKQTFRFPRLPHSVAARVSNQISTFNGPMSVATSAPHLQRWQTELTATSLIPPTPSELRSYLIPMVGIYPARGCPYNCNYCSVVKIAGKKVRGQSVEATLDSLIAAKKAGVRLVMFTSDNFNKYPDAKLLLQGMIELRINVPFFVQCDLQLSRDDQLVEMLGRAGCAQVFLGVESLNAETLKAVRKFQNDPARYAALIRMCHTNGITTHFSNIIGFPDQDEAMILEHVQELRSLGPFMASFYILTPIPGTDQYDDFCANGLITEQNLDRFDATCTVWRHPRIEGEVLETLLFRAYRDFYSPWDVIRKMFLHRWNASLFVHALGLAYAGIARHSAYRRMHPMAGGVWHVKVDRAADYVTLRKRIFGVDNLRLPRSLPLSKGSDRMLYQNLVIPRKAGQ